METPAVSPLACPHFPLVPPIDHAQAVMMRLLKIRMILPVGILRGQRHGHVVFLKTRPLDNKCEIARNPTTIVHGPNQWECTENCEQVKLWRIPPDNEWHYFEIEATYAHDGTRKITSMRWDSLLKYPNLTMGKTKQAWDQSFTVQCQNGNTAKYFKLCGNYVTRDSVRYAKLFAIQKQS